MGLQYNQVPRILNPVVMAVDALPGLYKDPHVRKYIDSLYGDIETARYVTCASFKGVGMCYHLRTPISRYVSCLHRLQRISDAHSSKLPCLHEMLRTTPFAHLAHDAKLRELDEAAWCCRKSILVDFFRHGFDGSGADNFFDAGKLFVSHLDCFRADIA